jgi:uncharacterized OsmC-like protein
MPTIRVRPTTVGASLSRDGAGRVVAHSGAAATLAVSASDEGLTPLELMDAALAGCLVISVRIAARKFGWLDRLVQVSVDVTHEKAPEGPSRIAAFTTAFVIEGDLSADEREQLIAEAHNICTVGNTLGSGAAIRDAEPAADR